MKKMGKPEQLAKLRDWTDFWMQSIRSNLEEGQRDQAVNAAYVIHGAWRYATVIGVATEEQFEQARKLAFDLAICGREDGEADESKRLQSTPTL